MAVALQNKLSFYPSHLKWLHDNTGKCEDYLNTVIDFWSKDWVREEFYRDPWMGRQVIEDYITNEKDTNENINRLLNYIRKPEVFVILILGMPGSGKTTTAYKIAELLKNEYRVLQVAPLITDGVLPDWIHWVSHISKARDGDLVIVDEASIKNNARRASSRQNMDDLGWLAVGRQIGCKIMYITQISAMADLNITRWTNIIISKGYSTSAVGASEIERQHIAENPILRYLKPMAGYAGVESREKDWSVVTIASKIFMCCLKAPDFMSEGLSKPYARFIEAILTPEIETQMAAISDEYEREKAEEKLIQNVAMKWADIMKKDGQFASTIKTELEIRGFRKSLQYWKEFTGEAGKKQSVDDYFD